MCLCEFYENDLKSFPCKIPRLIKFYGSNLEINIRKVHIEFTKDLIMKL